MKTFLGREAELKNLEDRYKSKQGHIVCVYGRRRIGKSSLIEEFISRGNKPCYKFEGLENIRTPGQIQNFISALAEQSEKDYISSLQMHKWEEVLTYFTNEFIKNRKSKSKLVIVLDELQWLAAKQSKLIALLKYYWDNHWKNANVLLILCGSVASYMVDRVIRSKALYGRIDLEILLRQLYPQEAKLFFRNKKSKQEILKYLMVFGGVPKYLELIDLKKSFNQNINDLCFSPEAYMLEEASKVFYSQFKETDIYLSIVELLKDKIYSFSEISTKLKLASGGGLKRYLRNLENANIIFAYSPSIFLPIAHNVKYKLSDEYLIFYFKFIYPNISIIKKEGMSKIFEKRCEISWQPWLGFAFERFCIRHAMYLASIMGFADEVIDFAPYFSKSDHSFQIDLLYIRTDNVIVVCEIKYHEAPVGTQVIPEMERKIKLLKYPSKFSIQKAIISLNGLDEALVNSEYFDYQISLEDMF